MRTLQRVADAAGDWDKLLGECAEKLHQIALMQLLPQKSSDNNEHFSFLAKHFSPENVQFFIKSLFLVEKIYQMHQIVVLVQR